LNAVALRGSFRKAAMFDWKGGALFKHRLFDPCYSRLVCRRATGIALIAILLALLLPTHAPRAAERSAAGGVEDAAGHDRLDPSKEFSESVIDTALLPLEVSVYSLHEKLPDGTAFMVAGDRILLADRTGGFAEIDMREATPAVRALPFRIDLYEDQLLEFAADRGVVDFYLLRILDLASLNDGRQFAVSYTRWDREKKCVSLFVAINDLPANWRAVDPEGWRIIFESQPCLPLRLDGTSLFAGHQAGGRLLERAPGRLVLTVGDFEYDGVNRTPIHPQDRTSDYGKIFEIEWKAGTRTLLSMGHRNPQGLAIDAEGRLWSTEHGPHGGDELNLIVPGSNYGWPLMTYGINYEGNTWPLSPRQGWHDDKTYRAPRHAWVPSIGISNLIAVSNFAPEWEGDLLVASLRGEQLRRLRLNGDSIVYDEPIGLEERLRDIGQLADGRIVLWTDTDNLIVLRQRMDESGEVDRRIAALPAKLRATIQSCVQCHSLRHGTGDGSKIGLVGIYGRAIGSANPELYSGALKRLAGMWDDAMLDRFLEDPERWAPGTTMQFSGIKDNQLRNGVIAFLRTLK
jgi:cytochrome c2